MTSGTRHLELVAPPPAPAPWWHIRPAERRPLALILGVGGPVGFAAGALLGIFLQIPGPALPAGRGMPGTVTTSVAPPGTSSTLSPARRVATGSDVPTRRAGKVDATRPQAVAPSRRADTPPTVTITATARTSAVDTPTTPPTSLPPSGTPAAEDDNAGGGPGARTGRGDVNGAGAPPDGSGRT